MSALVALLELLMIGSMALGAAAIAIGLGAWLTRDEEPPLVPASHVVRNASGAFATIALSTMIGAMVFVLVPILFVLTPLLLLAAWTLLEPPPARYA
jgi:hypothetical protein